MTDEELAKHCVCGCIYLEAECPNCNKVTDADRIEALVKERDTWQKETLRQNGLMHNAMLGAAKAEAKLTKAVAALRFYSEGEWPQNYPCGVLYAAGNDTPEFKTHLDYGDRARAALAELEKTE